MELPGVNFSHIDLSPFLHEWVAVYLHSIALAPQGQTKRKSQSETFGIQIAHHRIED